MLESDYQLELENNNIAESPKYDSDEDSFPCPLPLDLATLFTKPNDFVPQVSMANIDSDSNIATPIIEMTYEQWKEDLSTNPYYQGEFYMPQHF